MLCLLSSLAAFKLREHELFKVSSRFYAAQILCSFQLLGKEDACHLAAPIEQRSENVTNGEMEGMSHLS